MTKSLLVGVIGGGIVGLATARAVARRFQQAAVSVLEKESHVVAHQTGHNSGVIHSGIYYKPGSLKARLCVEGSRALKAFCAEHGIPMKNTGKVIVATNETEETYLNVLLERAVQNGIAGVELIGSARLLQIEPYAQGRAALWVPSTAIVDYRQVAEAFATEIKQHRGAVLLNQLCTRLERTNDGWIVHTLSHTHTFDLIINCAGLHADRVAALAGLSTPVHIVPFRGEYYTFLPAYQHMVKGLIYPVPNPELPFLGVHFTTMVEGGVEAGPNAVFALAREGYAKMSLNMADLWESVRLPGLWKLFWRYGRVGAFEMYRSLSKNAFVRSLQKLVPGVAGSMLRPGGSGVRAQAIDAEGKLIDDFYFLEQPGALHVLNAPSPAATSSLSIGEYIANKLQPYFE